LFLLTSASLPASTVSLTGSTDLVAFNGHLDTITLGSASCPIPDTGTCTYGGSQPFGTGTLTWQFQTPNTTDNIMWSNFPDVGQIIGPTGGTFTVSDGVDSVTGFYGLGAFSDDGVADSNGYDGIELVGNIIDDDATLPDSDPNQGAFETDFIASGDYWLFNLDVGDCFSGNKAAACIVPTDPSAQFISFNIIAEDPEPGTMSLVAAGLLAAIAARRRRTMPAPH